VRESPEGGYRLKADVRGWERPNRMMPGVGRGLEESKEGETQTRKVQDNARQLQDTR
jgi:hypothetical protein